MENNPNPESPHRRGSLFWPLLLIAAGIFLLLNTTNVLTGSPWETLLQLWPLLLVVAGLDGIYRGDGFVGAIILIGIGIVFLLSNLGIVVIGSWLALLKFWPVLLIAFGLDLIIGSRSTGATVLGVLAGIVLLGAVVWFGLLSPGALRPTLQQETLSQPMLGASDAEVAITASMGSLSIAGGAEEGILLEGSVSLPVKESLETRYTVTGSRGRLRLENKGNLTHLYPNANPIWDLQLNTAPEIALKTSLIAGEQELNLTGLNLQSLDSETVFGKTTLILPHTDLSQLDIRVTIGQLVIFVPAKTGLSVMLDTGITGISLPPTFSRQEDRILSANYAEAEHTILLSVEQPIGSLVIKILE